MGAIPRAQPGGREGGRRRAWPVLGVAAAIASVTFATGCGAGGDRAASPALRELRRDYAVLRKPPSRADVPPKGSGVVGAPELRRAGPSADVAGVSLWLYFDPEEGALCPWLATGEGGGLQSSCLTPAEAHDAGGRLATAGRGGTDRAVTYGVVRDGPRCAVLRRRSGRVLRVPVLHNGWMTESRMGAPVQSVAYEIAPCR